MNIRFADDTDLDALGRLNLRLREGGRQEQISLATKLPGEASYTHESLPVYRRIMVADDGQEIRAAALLYHGSISIQGVTRNFCWLDMPISEGIVDRRFSSAIVHLMRSALKYQPFLLAIGGATPGTEAHRFFLGLGWKASAVPFLFYPVRLTKVLLGLNYIKNNPKLRYPALICAYSGLAAVGTGVSSLRRHFGSPLSAYQVSLEETFGDWADGVFEDAVSDYSAAVRSNATALNIHYPPDDPRYIRIRVKERSSGRDVGWLVVLNKQMNDNKYFGDLKVGTLANGFGRTADVPVLISAGLDYLAQAGSDLVVGNFSHRAWIAAARRLNMLSGPTNFYFFASRGASPLMEESLPVQDIHLVRGHADGVFSLV